MISSEEDEEEEMSMNFRVFFGFLGISSEEDEVSMTRCRFVFFTTSISEEDEVSMTRVFFVFLGISSEDEVSMTRVFFVFLGISSEDELSMTRIFFGFFKKSFLKTSVSDEDELWTRNLNFFDGASKSFSGLPMAMLFMTGGDFFLRCFGIPSLLDEPKVAALTLLTGISSSLSEKVASEGKRYRFRVFGVSLSSADIPMECGEVHTPEFSYVVRTSVGSSTVCLVSEFRGLSVDCDDIMS